MAGSDCVISIVAPVDNDAQLLAGFVERLWRVLSTHYTHFEVVLVDNQSLDHTSAAVDELMGRYSGLRLVRLAKHYGEDVAVAAGLDAAIGDYVVVLQPRYDPVEEIPAMIDQACTAGGVVQAESVATSPLRRFEAACRSLAAKGLGRLLGVELAGNSSGFMVLSRPVVNAICAIRSRHRHLPALAAAVGASMRRHAIAADGPNRRPRRPLSDLWAQARAVSVAGSKRPLRMVSALGAIGGGLNLCYGLYVVAIYLFKDNVAPGWCTLSLQNAGMFFLVFLNLVLMAEYIGQILVESQDRPLYHVEEERSGALRAVPGERLNVLEESGDESRRAA